MYDFNPQIKTIFAEYLPPHYTANWIFFSSNTALNYLLGLLRIEPIIADPPESNARSTVGHFESGSALPVYQVYDFRVLGVDLTKI